MSSAHSFAHRFRRPRRQSCLLSRPELFSEPPRPRRDELLRFPACSPRAEENLGGEEAERSAFSFYIEGKTFSFFFR